MIPLEVYPRYTDLYSNILATSSITAQNKNVDNHRLVSSQTKWFMCIWWEMRLFEALLHSLLHWPTYIQPEDTMEEVSHRDHMLYDSIYRKCSEQANPPWLESSLEVSRGWEKGRMRKG